jgi:hypothetical protein
MFVTIIGMLLKTLSGEVLGKVLDFLKNKADNETERQKIIATTQAQIITTGMSHKAFWIPWLIATVPLAGWFGYGMLNTCFTSLPHVAEIPPGLLPWAQTAWGGLFYSGAGVASASMLSNALSRIFK